MKFFATAVVSFSLMIGASADELVKGVQAELKEQGFYYGEVTGLNSAETTSAIKRYQIRNGLEVTGSLTGETLDALGIEGAAPVAPVEKKAPPLEVPERKATPIEPVEPERAAPPAAKRPPVDLRRRPTEREADREYLERQPRQPGPSGNGQPPPAAGPEASGNSTYGRLFSRTPYATAPFEVQQGTVLKAQKFLRDLSIYREASDGRPSPALEEAILSYQRFIKLPLSGRLDMETLAAMRLLPGRGGSPVRPASRAGTKRTLRGVLVQ